MRCPIPVNNSHAHERTEMTYLKMGLDEDGLTDAAVTAARASIPSMTMTEERATMRCFKRISLLIAGCVLGIGAYPAVAQSERSAADKPICTVFTNEKLGGQLTAACRDNALVLGPADAWEVVENQTLEATIIDLTWSGERRVFMISFHDGEPLLEDLGGTLARSAGRGARADLTGLEIDFSSFAEDSKVKVEAPAVEGRAQSLTAEVDLGQAVAAESARQGAAREQK
jgi:hypothetical protein